MQSLDSFQDYFFDYIEAKQFKLKIQVDEEQLFVNSLTNSTALFKIVVNKTIRLQQPKCQNSMRSNS